MPESYLTRDERCQIHMLSGESKAGIARRRRPRSLRRSQAGCGPGGRYVSDIRRDERRTDRRR